jgi:hypothetical protein
MATITKEEFVEQLRTYIVDELRLLDDADKPKGLRENVEFNKVKAREFQDFLASEGITIE